MLLGPLFERYINGSPLSVMARATIEHALSAQALNDLFERTAESGYTRELLFSTTVDLMSLVVGTKGHQVKSAYQQLVEQIPVTLKQVRLREAPEHRDRRLCRAGPLGRRPLRRADHPTQRRVRALVDRL